MHRIEASALLALLLAGAAALALPPPLQSRMTQLPASLQHELQAHDAAWTALAPAQQQALRARVAAWDALPDAVRRPRREHWQAWQSLPASERAAGEAAASRCGCCRHSALPPSCGVALPLARCPSSLA